MKKVLKFGLVLALLGAALFAAWWYFFPSKNVNGLNLIPEDAIYIIHTDQPVDNWKKLSQSGVWKFLKGHPTFAEISGYADYLDDLIKENKTVFNLLGKRDLFISAHKTKARDYDFLFAIDLKKAAGIAGLKSALQMTFERGGYKVSSRTHKEVEILEVYDPVAKDYLFMTMIKNFLVASYTSKLVEKSIEQYDLPYLARENKFTDLVSITDDDGLAKLYVQYAYLDDYLNCYMSTPDDMVNDLSEVLRFSSTYFDITDDRVLANGYTNVNDSMESYLRALMLSGKSKNGAQEVLSNRTALYLSFGFESFKEFKSNLMAVLRQSPEKEAEISKWITKIEKLLKINVEEHLLGWIGQEVAYAQNKPSKYSDNREDDVIVVMQASDIEKAKESLAFVQKQIKKRTPARFKSMVFRNHEINYMEIKGFFKLFFGKLFNKIQKPYYTTIGDYVVFSNNPKTLVGMIIDYEDGKTLQASESFGNFKKDFHEESSLFCYIAAPQMFPLLQRKSSAETWKSLKDSKKYITSFVHSGFQLTSAGDKFKTQVLLRFEEDVEEPEMMQNMDTLDLIFNAQVFDISTYLDSMDDAERFILNKVEKGVFKRNYPDSDQLEIEAETDDGVLHGDYKEYYINGEVRVDGRYRKGRKTGTWKIYGEQGELLEKIRYKW